MLLIVNWADIQRHHEKNGVSMKGLMMKLPVNTYLATGYSSILGISYSLKNQFY